MYRYLSFLIVLLSFYSIAFFNPAARLQYSIEHADDCCNLDLPVQREYDTLCPTSNWVLPMGVVEEERKKGGKEERKEERERERERGGKKEEKRERSDRVPMRFFLTSPNFRGQSGDVKNRPTKTVFIIMKVDWNRQKKNLWGGELKISTTFFGKFRKSGKKSIQIDKFW